MSVLRGSTECEATDIRDRVYALLSLTRTRLTNDAQSSDVAILTVDYSRSTSQVFQDVARYVMNRHKMVSLLYLGGRFGKANDISLPSWTPDWRQMTDIYPFGVIEHAVRKSGEEHDYEGEFFCRADKFSTPSACDQRNRAEDDILALQGVILAEVLDDVPADSDIWHWSLFYENGKTIPIGVYPYEVEKVLNDSRYDALGAKHICTHRSSNGIPIFFSFSERVSHLEDALGALPQEELGGMALELRSTGQATVLVKGLQVVMTKEMIEIEQDDRLSYYNELVPNLDTADIRKHSKWAYIRVFEGTEKIFRSLPSTIAQEGNSPTNIFDRLASTLYVPKTAKGGDLVAVVKGGVLPITIRRQELEAVTFTYVGPALLAFASEEDDSDGSDDSDDSEDSDDSDDDDDNDSDDVNDDEEDDDDDNDNEDKDDDNDGDDQADEGEEGQEANDNSDSEKDEESKGNYQPSPLDCYKNMQDLLRNPTLLQPLNLV